jgi:predicted esterase YcpF (UPF0227 family)
VKKIRQALPRFTLLLHTLNASTPKLIAIYVDDIFVVVKDKDAAIKKNEIEQDPTQQQLNSLHLSAYLSAYIQQLLKKIKTNVSKSHTIYQSAVGGISRWISISTTIDIWVIKIAIKPEDSVSLA